MYVDNLSMTVMLRYIHSACAAVLVCDLDAECRIGFRKLLRLLSGTNETILDVLWGGVIVV